MAKEKCGRGEAAQGAASEDKRQSPRTVRTTNALCIPPNRHFPVTSASSASLPCGSFGLHVLAPDTLQVVVHHCAELRCGGAWRRMRAALWSRRAMVLHLAHTTPCDALDRWSKVQDFVMACGSLVLSTCRVASPLVTSLPSCLTSHPHITLTSPLCALPLASIPLCPLQTSVVPVHTQPPRPSEHRSFVPACTVPVARSGR